MSRLSTLSTITLFLRGNKELSGVCFFILQNVGNTIIVIIPILDTEFQTGQITCQNPKESKSMILNLKCSDFKPHVVFSIVL